MDIKELARELRKAAMDQAEEDGRHFVGSHLDAVFEKLLEKHLPKPSPYYTWGTVVAQELPEGVTIDLPAARLYLPKNRAKILLDTDIDVTEWR